jgi:cytochrome c oxidase cbb3-type subunit 3
MPAFATPVPYARYDIEPLKPREIEAVLAYVLSLNGAVQPAALETEGKEIFHDAKRGMCADCHGFDAKGDNVVGAPDLTDGVWLRGDGSPRSVRDTIERGLGGSCPAWESRMSAATVRALAVYIHWRSHCSHSPNDAALDAAGSRTP